MVARPQRVGDVARLQSAAPRDSLARGAGRGFGDNAINSGGGVLLMERLDRLLAFDPQTGLLDVEAGCTLARIIQTFLPRGFFPLVTPGTKHVTVGGAIAADVHGKNHHRDGSFAAGVEHLDLMPATGQVLRCSRQSNADAFWATCGGMGLTGTILSARLRLHPVTSAFIQVRYEQTANLDQTLSRFSETDQLYRYSVAWIDCLASGAKLGRSVLMLGDHASAAQAPDEYRDHPLKFDPRRPRRIPFYLPGFVLNPWTVKAFNGRFYRRHATRNQIVDYDSFFYPLDSISNYYRMYGRRGFVQYQAVFPQESSRPALVRMLGKLSESHSASFLAVLKSMGAANPGMLSFPMPGHTLALDMPHTGARLLEVVRELDRIVLDHGGRIYLAKDAFLNRQALDRMYPQLPRFLQIKAQLDPENRIASSMARRLELVP